MSYYHACPNCSANLDPGESCDCQQGLPFVTVPNDYGTHKELYREEVTVNIIKVKFLKDGQPSGRAYTYYSEKPVEVGDKVQINSASVGVVTEINVPEEEIKDYMDKVKFIYGKYQEPDKEVEGQTV
ncbi:MAG: hypothetical protein K0R34_4096 [Herbinix sp.]|jgi:hypothetical protein|nr:hypothetical protein [Herbinix sp.]